MQPFREKGYYEIILIVFVQKDCIMRPISLCDNVELYKNPCVKKKNMLL